MSRTKQSTTTYTRTPKPCAEIISAKEGGFRIYKNDNSKVTVEAPTLDGRFVFLERSFFKYMQTPEKDAYIESTEYLLKTDKVRLIKNFTDKTKKSVFVGECKASEVDDLFGDGEHFTTGLNVYAMDGNETTPGGIVCFSCPGSVRNMFMRDTKGRGSDFVFMVSVVAKTKKAQADYTKEFGRGQLPADYLVFSILPESENASGYFAEAADEMSVLVDTYFDTILQRTVETTKSENFDQNKISDEAYRAAIDAGAEPSDLFAAADEKKTDVVPNGDDLPF